MLLTGAQIVAEVLLEQKVDTVFGYPGGAVLNIYDALYDYRDRIHHYMTAHEQGAAHAADGYARATGKTGVVIATSGPGATNIVTGVATAYMDSVPMVAITGNVNTDQIGKDSFQEVFIGGITMSVTKHNYVVRRIEDLAPTLRRAFAIAQEGRKGPVLVDIPKNITAAKMEFEPAEPVKPVYESRTYPNLPEVAERINKSRRPMIYFGGGVRLSGAGDELRQLVEKADIPAAYTIMAAGILGYGERNNLGLLGMHGCLTANRAASEADVILAIGTRFSDRVALNPKEFAAQARIIHMDIDASEINKNVKVDECVVGDAKDILSQLLPLIKETKHEEWMKKVDEWRTEDYRPADSREKLLPHQIIHTLCDMAGEDAFYVTDVGQHQMWTAQYLKRIAPGHFLTSGGLGTMGYGYGASIGAKIGIADRRPVIHITGDGSFHMNMNEACTAVSYQVPVITVILNNSVLGMVRQWQTEFYQGHYSSTEPERKTNYVKVAEGFGAKGYHCETLEELKAAMAEALKQNGPVWIECVIDREEKVLPMIPAGGTIDDIMLD
jgi:acetolactate synthase-1/2/3 large subunit